MQSESINPSNIHSGEQLAGRMGNKINTTGTRAPWAVGPLCLPVRVFMPLTFRAARLSVIASPSLAMHRLGVLVPMCTATRAAEFNLNLWSACASAKGGREGGRLASLRRGLPLGRGGYGRLPFPPAGVPLAVPGLRPDISAP